MKTCGTVHSQTHGFGGPKKWIVLKLRGYVLHSMLTIYVCIYICICIYVFIYIYVFIAADAVCCPDINIANAVLSNI